MMILLLAALLSLQQSDEELRALVERFNAGILPDDPDSYRKLPWDDIRRAGPGIVKHIAAVFPGKQTRDRRTCRSDGWSPESEYPLVRTMYTFKEAALPFLIRLSADPDEKKARLATAMLRHYRSQEVVAPLVGYSRNHNLNLDPQLKPKVYEALAQATFLRFKSPEEIETWYETAKTRTQLEWLNEAMTAGEKDRAARDHAVKAIERLPAPEARLNALIRCYVDLEWNEARQGLYYLTGHAMPERWINPALNQDPRYWSGFRHKSGAEQELEIALHANFRAGSDTPPAFLLPERGEKLLLENADRAFDFLEKIAPDHPACGGNFYAALHWVATSKNWDRVVKFVPALKLQYMYIDQLLQNSRHPSMADQMFEMVLSGKEGITFGMLMSEFPKRVRADMVPRILEGIPASTGRPRDTLLSALGATGDLRGWDILEKEFFENPDKEWNSVEVLQNFAGEKAVNVLRRLLKSRNYQVLTLTARALADRGDFSGIPVLIQGLETCDLKTESRYYLWSLGWIRGGYPPGVASPLTAPAREAAVAEFKEWWSRHKDLSRVAWLLESLDTTAASFASGLPGFHNPLLILAHDEWKDIPKDLPDLERGKLVVERVRAWVERTGFTFNKDTVRVPYRRDLR